MIKYLYTIAFIFITNILFGQIKFGIKAGGQMTDIATVTSSEEFKEYKKELNKNSKKKISYHFGGYVNIRLNTAFSTQIELLYSNKGSVTPKKEPYNPERSRNDLHYLNLPLLLIYSPIPKLEIEAGPEFGYLLAARMVTKNKSSTVLEYFYKDLDFGVNVGTRYFITNSLNLGLRVCWGLANTVEADFRDANGDPINGKMKTQNRALQLSVGYTFGK